MRSFPRTSCAPEHDEVKKIKVPNYSNKYSMNLTQRIGKHVDDDVIVDSLSINSSEDQSDIISFSDKSCAQVLLALYLSN
jgi:hypothetical protein